MSNRVETVHPEVNLLCTGHFQQGKGYEAWRPHGTRDWLLIYTIEGKGRFGHPQGEIVSRPGDLILLRPGTPHDYGVEGILQHWELLWTHFHPRPHWLEWMAWPEAAAGLRGLHLEGATRDAVVARFHECHRLASGAMRRREELAMNALEEVLLRCDAANPLSEASRGDERVREAMEYICQNFARHIDLGQIAEAASLSVSRLSHLFRAETGTTPQQFLESQRLARAVQLLELTPLSIKQIAGQVGFDSPFYFTLRFKKQMGVSPRGWREKGKRSGASP
jgi:AraC family transcriptional regulator of arabinose operon